MMVSFFDYELKIQRLNLVKINLEKEARLDKMNGNYA